MPDDPHSFAQAVARRATLDPDGEVVRRRGGPAWTAGELLAASEEIGRGLSRRIGRGDAVATAVDAGPDAVAVTTALSLLGAVEVPLPPGVTATWARTLVARAGCRLLIACGRRLDDEPQLRRLTEGIVVTDRTGTGESLDDVRAAPGHLRRHDPRPGDPAVVMSTSGTTGRPKAAVLPHGAGLAQAARVRRAMDYRAGDVLLNFFPWQHINARHAAVLPALLSGARVVLAPRFSASTFWASAADDGITAFNFMGAVAAILLRTPPTPADRGHRVTRAYGGPAPEWLFRQFGQRFGVSLLQAYACTELGDVATTTAGDVLPGAAGRPVDDYDLRVVGADGTEQAAGELLVRPRRPHLTFAGYLGDPVATAAAWDRGWFRTGDRVRLVEGRLHVEGRSADVIRRRGVTIGAVEVEDVIAAMPEVAEVAVVGVPSELTEDEVLAVVVPAPGHRLDPAAVRAWCRGRLAPHAAPRFVSVEDRLPRNAALKVVRAQLRGRGLPAGVWDAEAVRRTAS